jgi:hypothetical protein
MLRDPKIWLVLIPMALWAGDEWKNKRAAEWTDEETKQVLTASPWAAMVTPTVKKAEQKQTPRGGVVGIPGIGRRREQTQDPNESNAPSSDSAPLLNIRWESALPVREAELKARETNAPDVDADHYAIAVYGLPTHLAKDPQHLGDRLKDQATIKREGQKDLKPSHVDVLVRDDGVVIVYLFPRSKEITAKDSRAEFNAQIAQFQIVQSFHVDEMIYQGKVEF